ncbi:hypothetical protein [Zhihengliuella salsuginis]|uniref:TM2 domain-containing protein n=1 Tax=Zhihengliuella salsuginis TaxID=578222 RepID=A0ABQ3GGI9_9MICC|nr:hypothetical protein [Zhihengliuella salsuginis]GHD05336.1 hypothetical protein GCM10008096_14090 [Zhihengliuella salsuginis]
MAAVSSYPQPRFVLLTLGGFGIWALIDWILILAGVTREKRGLPLAGHNSGQAAGESTGGLPGPSSSAAG